jgi:hypothetical protein
VWQYGGPDPSNYYGTADNIIQPHSPSYALSTYGQQIANNIGNAPPPPTPAPPPTPTPSGLTQSQINAIMASINATQVAEVPAGECFSGICYPQEALVGDILITQSPNTQAYGSQGSFTDNAGNTWSLIADIADTKYGTPPDWWWGGLALNGSVLPGYEGYFIALRYRPSDGSVWIQEAKQGGWWNLTVAQATPNAFTNFTRPGLGGDPGH